MHESKSKTTGQQEQQNSNGGGKRGGMRRNMPKSMKLMDEKSLYNTIACTINIHNKI